LPDRTKTEVARVNEQVKLLAAVIGNLGTGLTAAAAARWYVSGVDLVLGSWIFVSIVLIWTAYRILTLIDSEAYYD
jgi:phosphate/sulfate permease